MKIGVIIGSASGKGNAPDTISALASRLRSHEVAVCGEVFGCDELPSSWFRLSPAPSDGYVEGLQNAVRTLLDWGSNLLVCVGGDGLASYALDIMISCGKKAQLLGIASGTINVGPVVAFKTEDIPTLDFSSLSVQSIDAVEVCVDECHLAYAVNDVIIGNSFLGTLNGEIANLSSRELLHGGRKLKIDPSSDITDKYFRLSKNGLPIAISMANPAQIIVSPLRKREFFGRAISGVLCNAAFMDGAAALGLFDTILVRAAEPLRGFNDTACSEHLLFGPGDLVEIEGLGPDADIIVDGNPYERGGEVVSFRFHLNVAEVLVPSAANNGKQEGIV